MAESVQKDKSEDIKCGICLSPFTEPLLLDCYHVFCTPCVSKLAEDKQSFNCPLCRTLHLLENNGVDGLQSYPYLEDYTKSLLLKVESCCEMCENGKCVFSRCDDCGANMCRNCHDYHLKHVKFKTHKTEIKDISSEEESADICHETGERCELHSKDLTLFCRPCNKAICELCTDDPHKFHKIDPLIPNAQKRRDFLLSGIGAMKSIIIATETEIDRSKFEENAYYKLCRQGKDDVKEHAERSKAIVCSIIDELASKNLKKIEEIQKEDTKQITTYQEELERENVSLKCLLKSTEDIVNLCPNATLLNRYPYLYNNLQNYVGRRRNKPIIYGPQLYSGCIEHDTVEKFFGNVKRNEQAKVTNQSDAHVYFLPEMGDVSLSKIHTIQMHSAIKSLCEFSDDRMWTLYGGSCYLYSVIKPESVLRTLSGSSNDTQIIKATEDELWIKCDSIIRKVALDETQTPVVVLQSPNIENNPCCLTEDGNIILYSKTDGQFHDIKIQTDLPTVIDETTTKIKSVEKEIRDTITGHPSCIKETMRNNIMITYADNILTVNRQFKLLNIYQNTGSSFRGICGDRYGRMFVTDYSKSSIVVLSSSGDFRHDVPLKDVQSPTHIARDSSGNLWVTNGYQVHVFSYLQ